MILMITMSLTGLGLILMIFLSMNFFTMVTGVEIHKKLDSHLLQMGQSNGQWDTSRLIMKMHPIVLQNGK